MIVDYLQEKYPITLCVNVICVYSGLPYLYEAYNKSGSISSSSVFPSVVLLLEHGRYITMNSIISYIT